MAVLLGAAIGAILGTVGGLQFRADSVFIVAAIGASIGALFVFSLGNLRLVCSYVGTDGLAEFESKRLGGRLTKDSVFLFRFAADAKLILLKGTQQGTAVWVDATWKDIKGKTLHQITSICKTEGGDLPKASGYDLPDEMDCYFAISAHKQWQEFCTLTRERVGAETNSGSITPKTTDIDDSKQQDANCASAPSRRASRITQCPKCKMRVIPKHDGNCPSCQTRLSSSFAN